MNRDGWRHIGGYFLCVLVLAVVNTTDAIAEECQPTGNYCTPVVGCIAETGEMFWGVTRGREFGPLAAVSSFGASCAGTWKKVPLALGAAHFTCSDGRSGTSLYTYFEKSTGTAIGNGTFQNGQVIRFWAGWNLEDYFNNVAPKDREAMRCKVEDLLVG